MKIAVVAQGSIPAQTANSIQNIKMAAALSGLGHEVRVFAPGTEPSIEWAQLARHYGIKNHFGIQWIPFRPLFRRYDFAFKAVRATKEWNADLLYTRLPQAATLAATRGIPTIFELHDLPSGSMGPWLLRRFLSAPGAQRLVVNTQHLAEEIQKSYRISQETNFLVLAPNGVDLERYAQLPDPETARKALGLPDGFMAGYTGHLYAGRGISLILEMARELPEIRFLLVGGRPEDVARRKQQAGDLDNVAFTGFVPQAEMPNYQAACDVFLMPHGRKVAGSSGADIAEFTNPLKMFEYLACGRPIMASNLTILREILSEENAVILPSENPQSWIKALRMLQSSPGRRKELSEAGKKTASQYSWEKRAQRVLHNLVVTAKI
jgi:glycosyltransferase involved in cell wall biosynthesis